MSNHKDETIVEKMNEMETNLETPKSRVPLMIAAAIVLVLGGGIGALAYLGVSSQRVYIEDSTISAPNIPLAPTVTGTLQHVYVSEGQSIPANTVVAEVGSELITSTEAGLVITTNTDIGSDVQAGTPVVTMIDPTALRVVGQLEEDKGLADVQVGDRAVFTVDAFPGKSFQGVVSEVAPTAESSDVVFQVSDQREEQKFNVSVAYNLTDYPQLKNGMSAKIWVYKQ